MDFVTISIENYNEVLKLLKEADEAQRVNVYSKNRIKKAIELLKK
tara:strand:- start:8041 stop:8175 length:135 start_codon:yes stop_codon:yes gene_type:complete